MTKKPFSSVIKAFFVGYKRLLYLYYGLPRMKLCLPECPFTRVAWQRRGRTGKHEPAHNPTGRTAAYQIFVLPLHPKTK